MCFGAFDILHKGHIFFLTESIKYGDVLYIVLATDNNILKYKNKAPYFSLNIRKKNLEEKFPNFIVLPGDEINFLCPLEKITPDIICLGYDQKINKNEILKKFPKIKIKKIKAYFPEKYKSSFFRKN